MYNLLEKKNLTNCKIVNILIKTKSFIKMLKNNNYKKIDIKIYYCFIRKLIYLLYSIRPNIAFVIKQLRKWNADFKIGHLKIAKQVLKYLKRTMHLGITYGAGKVKPLPYGPIKYTNYNYIKDLKNCKSIIEYYFYVNRCNRFNLVLYY